MSFLCRNRRAFLKAAGICIALPTLEAFPRRARAKEQLAPPRRMVCVGNEFGMYPGAFWPEQAGTDFALPPLLHRATS